MNQPRKNTHSGSIRRPGDNIKGRVYLAGIQRLGLLAEAAGISQQSLTDHLSGRRRSAQTQERIRQAFCTLTAAEIDGPEFWGVLHREYQTPRRGRRHDDRSAA